MRYFIVFYEGFKTDDNAGFGHIAFPNKTFPSFRALSEDIAVLYGFQNVVITNIKEVNEKDYNDWVSTEGEQELDFM